MDITTQVRDPLRAPTTMTHSTRTQQYFRAALLTDASRQLVAAVLHTVGIWTAAAFDFGTPLAAHTLRVGMARRTLHTHPVRP